MRLASIALAVGVPLASPPPAAACMAEPKSLLIEFRQGSAEPDQQHRIDLMDFALRNRSLGTTVEIRAFGDVLRTGESAQDPDTALAVARAGAVRKAVELQGLTVAKVRTTGFAPGDGGAGRVGEAGEVRLPRVAVVLLPKSAPTGVRSGPQPTC